jgi:hypothetical protein
LLNGSRHSQSAYLHRILKQKAARLSTHNMKERAALIEPSELDLSEAKLCCYRCDGWAGIGIVAQYEYGLTL